MEADPIRDTILVALSRHWGFHTTHHDEVFSGRNSRVWRVTDGSAVLAAKLVRSGDSDMDHFDAGLRLAARLDSPDMPVGAPLPANCGGYTVSVSGGRLGLMWWVHGAPLGTGQEDLWRIGATLARLHERATRMPAPGVPRWPWEWLTLRGRPVRDPGDSQLVAEVAARVRQCEYAHGIVHGDPTPETFIAVEGGSTGILDWASVLYGPVLYDVATLTLVIRRRGGTRAQTEILEAAYARYSRIDPEEMTRLDTLRALRLGIEILYHTSRFEVVRDPAVLAEHDVALRHSRRQLTDILV
jgi:homoserine kinase type II